jgi:hypothetical protein
MLKVNLWLLAWFVPLWLLRSVEPGLGRWALCLIVVYAFVQWLVALVVLVRSGVGK